MTPDKVLDRYRNDWRAVCNALNISPDSATDVVLAKIKVLHSGIAAAVQAEREACARVADEHEDGYTNTYSDSDADYNSACGYNEACGKIAAAIRSRSNGFK